MGHAAQRGRGARHRFKAHANDTRKAYQMPDGALYISESWRAFTRTYLEYYPACARCKGAGRTVKATVARHIKPRVKGRDDYDPENVQSLCLECIGITVAPVEPEDDPGESAV